MSLRIFLILSCLLIVSFVSAQEFKYSAKNAETLSIQNLYADLQIEAYKGAEIIIKTKNFQSKKTDPRANGLKSAFNMEDNTGIGLKISREGNLIFISSAGGKKFLYRRLSYEILIPESLNLEITNKSKDFFQLSKVYVKNISRSLVFESNYGNLYFEDITGPTSISVEQGNVEGIFSKLSQKGDSYIVSLYGIIDVTLPDNTPVNLYLKDPYGDIFTDFNIEYSKEKSSKDNLANGIIEGKINGGGVRLQIKSESNNIYLRRKSGNTRPDFGIDITKQVPKEASGQKLLAIIDKVEDSRDMTAEFELVKEQHVRVFAIGERSNEGDMADYGYIEDAKTKKVVWEMKERETRHAGGADKNRMIDAYMTLPSGKYILHYVTDDSHSYNDWNSDPPDYDFWGIAVFTGDSKDKSFMYDTDEEINIPNVNPIPTITPNLGVPVYKSFDKEKEKQEMLEQEKEIKKTEKEIKEQQKEIEQTEKLNGVTGIEETDKVSDVLKPISNEDLNKFKEQLIMDKLIDKKSKCKIDLSSNGFYVNGKKQTAETFNKYKKLYESFTGRKIDAGSHIKFDFNDEN
jgi:hypothetical protein